MSKSPLNRQLPPRIRPNNDLTDMLDSHLEIVNAARCPKPPPSANSTARQAGIGWSAEIQNAAAFSPLPLRL
jgi:hypothetical protein